jgi:hypothetical protein
LSALIQRKPLIGRLPSVGAEDADQTMNRDEWDQKVAAPAGAGIACLKNRASAADA